MAFQFNVNLTPGTNAEAVYRFKEHLKAQGWTVPRSSDGLTYNSSGDQITGFGSGANGMANNNAWFVIQSPTLTKQFCVQRGPGNTSWRVKYSRATGFSGGSPSATIVSTATDQVITAGGGTDASPTFANLFGGDASYRLHLMADNASPYGFYMLGITIGTAAVQSVMMFDPTAASSSPVEDLDQWVVYTSGSAIGANPLGLASAAASASSFLSNGVANNPGTWFKSGDPSAAFASVFPMSPAMFISGFSINAITHVQSGYSVSQGGIGTNSANGKEDFYPVIWARPSILGGLGGYKGISSLLKWYSAQRATGQTFTLLATGDRMIAGMVSVPWNGSTPVI